ncbi:MAG TPA: hypothetical protein VF062_05030 [Candidatus Limnocylindrales bacterium]
MRTIKARALTPDHVGCVATHAGASTPQRLVGVTLSLTRAYLYWAGGIDTCIRLDADVTIHEEAT